MRCMMTASQEPLLPQKQVSSTQQVKLTKLQPWHLLQLEQSSPSAHLPYLDRRQVTGVSAGNHLSQGPPHTSPSPLRHLSPPQAPRPRPCSQGPGAGARAEHQGGSTRQGAGGASSSTSRSWSKDILLSRRSGYN